MDMDSKNSFTEVLEKAIDDSDPYTPVFFILSPGADPVKEVEKICKKKIRLSLVKDFSLWHWDKVKMKWQEEE